MGERRAATAGLPWAAWASAMAQSSWSWVAGPVAAHTGTLDRRAAWPPRVRWPGRLTLAVARRAAWTACRRPDPGARRRIEVAVAWRRARELGRLRRASAAAGDAGQMPSLPGPGVALVRRWCAHRVRADARGPGPGGMRYRARHPTIARRRPRWRPATGGRRDAIPVARLPTPGPPGPGRGTGGRHLRFHRHGQVGLSPRHRRAARDRPRSCGDRPSGLGPVRHRLMSGCAVTGAGLSGARFLWLPGARDLTGWPRGIPGASPGRPAWPGRVARWAASVAPAGSR